MARVAYGRSQTRVSTSSYPDDNSSPVGTNEWNLDPESSGLLGFTKITATLDSNGQLSTKDDSATFTNESGASQEKQSTLIEVECNGSETTDAVVKIDITDTNENDIVYLFKATNSDTVTVTHTGSLSSAGQIQSLDGGSITLNDTGKPVSLMRRGNYWFEFGGGGGVADGTLTVASFDQSKIITQAEGIASNDNETTLPTSAAVKDYVDARPADITAVTAGTALTGGGTSGSVTVNADVGIGEDKLLQANANVADNDFLKIDGTKVEGRTATQVKSDLDLEIGTDVQAYNANTALTTNKISDFAASTSAELAGKISDETGSGALVFATSPALTTPTATQLDVLAQGELRLQDASGGQYVGFKAPTSVTNYTLTLPAATGSNGEVLKTNGSGVLSWGSAGGGATATHAYTNQSTTTYAGTGSSGTGIDVNTTVATEASGAGEREIFIKKIDTNNEGVFAIIHKNGKAVEVQIA
tara:strand:+ start:2789 stop:4207 length:1419 start_codon:yes stop_codon:yes gene_type:complete